MVGRGLKVGGVAGTSSSPSCLPSRRAGAGVGLTVRSITGGCSAGPFSLPRLVKLKFGKLSGCRCCCSEAPINPLISIVSCSLAMFGLFLFCSLFRKLFWFGLKGFAFGKTTGGRVGRGLGAGWGLEPTWRTGWKF